MLNSLKAKVAVSSGAAAAIPGATSRERHVQQQNTHNRCYEESPCPGLI